MTEGATGLRGRSAEGSLAECGAVGKRRNTQSTYLYWAQECDGEVDGSGGHHEDALGRGTLDGEC